MRSSPISALFALIALVAASPAFAQTKPPVGEVVELKGADGVMLKASYFSAGKPGPGLLLLHACNRDRSSWTKLATDASARGYNVLTLDFRGFGDSGGPRFDPTQQPQAAIDAVWPGDVDTAFAWLTAQKGVDKERIAAAGASCGVNQSVLLARRHPEVRTVVLLSGGVNEQAREFVRDAAWMPIFASASHGDSNAVGTMKWVLGWSRNPSNKFYEYKAAGHGTDMFAVEKGLEPAILTWFDTYLRNASTAKPAPVAATKPTVVEEFWTTLNSPGGIEKAKKIYADAKGKNPRVVMVPETETNALGYRLLQAGNAKDALAVFQLNVEAHPESANTYDSVSDAQLALGNRQEALASAQKSLEMLAKDGEASEEFKQLVKESAEKKVKELKGTETSADVKKR